MMGHGQDWKTQKWDQMGGQAMSLLSSLRVYYCIIRVERVPCTLAQLPWYFLPPLLLPLLFDSPGHSGMKTWKEMILSPQYS